MGILKQLWLEDEEYTEAIERLDFLHNEAYTFMDKEQQVQISELYEFVEQCEEYLEDHSIKLRRGARNLINMVYEDAEPMWHTWTKNIDK